MLLDTSFDTMTATMLVGYAILLVLILALSASTYFFYRKHAKEAAFHADTEKEYREVKAEYTVKVGRLNKSNDKLLLSEHHLKQKLKQIAQTELENAETIARLKKEVEQLEKTTPTESLHDVWEQELAREH